MIWSFFRSKFARVALIFVLGILFGALVMGCASDTPKNPMVGKKGELWWRTPVYQDTPKKDNPWMAYVKDYKPPNEFDPWANDDLQRYSVSPVITSSTTKRAAPKVIIIERQRRLRAPSGKQLEQLRRKLLREYKKRLQRKKRSSEVY